MENANKKKSNGSGVTFPLTIKNGKFQFLSYEDHIRQSILLLLQTDKGERMMRPGFGCGMKRLLFSPMNSSTLALMKLEIEEAVKRFEPRIELLNTIVRVDEKNKGMVMVDLSYKIIKADSRQNLVFPLYLYDGGIG
ncbi:MAG: GPW/gp25 family protein [Clostridia bacterium]|nr:GPW/gp25 family protein [Clostridia bacterium]